MSKQIPVERDGVHFTVGDDSDFSWSEMDALQLQIDRRNIHNPDEKPIKRPPPGMTRAMLDVKRIFPGAVIEHDPGPALDVRAFLDSKK